MLGNFACFFCCLIFFNQLFSRKGFANTTKVLNSLDPDQGQCFDGCDLGPKCLQRLSVDEALNELSCF